MNKMSQREYVMMVADELVKEYGSTLKEGGTDVKMATRVVKKMKMYLFFRDEWVSLTAFNKWKHDREDN